MAVADLRFTSQVMAPPQRVFDLVADLRSYGRWLPGSTAFDGVADVTPYPVRLGTTYRETGAIEKPGVVTEYDPPNHIGFHHIVKIRSPIETDVDARIRYSFEAREGGTFVVRELRMTMDLQGVLKLATPLLIWGFRRENERTLQHLKRYAEST